MPVSVRIYKHIQNDDRVFMMWTASDTNHSIDDTRKKESIEAMSYIGIPSENMIFLNYHQLELYKNIDKIVESYKEIIQKRIPTVCYTTAYEGGHIDHDIVNYCVYKAFEKINNIKLYEYPA